MGRTVETAAVKADQPTTLYRLFDENDQLLYVGITGAELYRLRQHSGDKSWWQLAVRATFTHYATRQEAEEAEYKAIKEEGPAFNLAGVTNPRPPTTIAAQPAPLPRLVDDDELAETFDRHCRRNFKMSSAELIEAIRRGDIRRDDRRLKAIANFMRDDWFVPQ